MDYGSIEDVIDGSEDTLDQLFHARGDLGNKIGRIEQAKSRVEELEDELESDVKDLLITLCERAIQELNFWVQEVEGAFRLEVTMYALASFIKQTPDFQSDDAEKSLKQLIEGSDQYQDSASSFLDTMESTTESITDLVETVVVLNITQPSSSFSEKDVSSLPDEVAAEVAEVSDQAELTLRLIAKAALEWLAEKQSHEASFAHMEYML
jgi:uncharacterized phage infection (PIP) family protein YhgE